MKNSFVIDLEPHEIKQFSGRKLKMKWDYIDLVFETLRFISFHYGAKKSRTLSTKYIKYEYIREQSSARIYVYISSDKYYSYALPFQIGEDNGFAKIYLGSMMITTKLLSNIFSICEDRIMNSINSLLELQKRFDDEDYSEDCFKVIEALFQYESGYVRHDHDETRKRGKIHPEFHFDINYDKRSTYKIGLNRMLRHNEFEATFDKDKNCHFIEAN